MTCCLSCLCQLSGTGEYHVYRTYDDFEWLQQHLFSQEDVPGIQGVIVSTLLYLCTICYLTCKPMHTVLTKTRLGLEYLYDESPKGQTIQNSVELLKTSFQSVHAALCCLFFSNCLL